MKKYICIFALTVMSCGSVRTFNGVTVKQPPQRIDKEIAWIIPSFFLSYYLAGSYNWKK